MRSLLCLLGWCLFLASFDPVRVYAGDVAVIQSQDLPLYEQALSGFRAVYPQPFRTYNLGGDPREADRVVRAMRQHPPDVIVTIGLLASRVARERFEQTPLVFSMVFAPERFSLGGERITGVTLDVPLAEVIPHIRRLFPSVRRIGMLSDPHKTGAMAAQAKATANAQGIALLVAEVASAQGLPRAVRSLIGKIDLLWLVPDSTVITPQSVDFLLGTSFEANLPVVTFTEDLVKRGAVAAVSPDYRAVGEETARLALRVLAGESPSTMPVRSVSRIHLSVNRKVAQKLRILFAENLLQSATSVNE